MGFFKKIPNKEIIIQEASLFINEFKNDIKLRAPLVINSCIIFVEVREERIKYGITNAEMSETSPSINNQNIGQHKLEEIQGITIAYIGKIGQKNVGLSAV